MESTTCFRVEGLRLHHSGGVRAYDGINGEYRCSSVARGLGAQAGGLEAQACARLSEKASSRFYSMVQAVGARCQRPRGIHALN